MSGLRTATIFLALGVSTILAIFTQECPQGPGCTDCTRLPGPVYQVICSKKEDSFFDVQYSQDIYAKPSYWLVDVFCVNTSSWSDFHLGAQKKLKYISKVSFIDCDIPQDRSLISVVNQFIDNNTTSEEVFDLENDSNNDGWSGNMALAFVSRRNLTLTLTRATLDGFIGYNELEISQNKLQNVSDDLLRGFNLTSLNLYKNDLRTISAEFLNFPFLTLLDLHRNKLQVIEKTTFMNLPMLEILYLSDNQIKKIASNSFDNNQNLIELNLSDNILTTLPPYIFDLLHNLEDLFVAGNFFSDLHSDLFLNNMKLRRIEMVLNKVNLTTLPSDLFKSQVNLESLFLHRNGLVELPPDLLRNLGELDYLTLARNYLSILPEGLFQGCQKLSQLDISYNRIVQVSASTFNGLNINHLNMAHNRVQYLDINAFQSTSQLREIYFNDNELSFDNISTIEQGVEKNLSPFHDSRNSIEILDLSNNSISGIYNDWLSAPWLQKLWLINNKLTHLSLKSIQFSSSYTVSLFLDTNKIRSIDLSGLDSIPSNHSYTDVQLFIEDNPVECDCSIYHLLRHHRKKTSAVSQKLFQIMMDNLKCAGPANLRNTLVKELDEKDLLCFAPATMCPTNCRCSLRAWDQAHLIDCSHRGLTAVPALSSPDSNRPVELNLSGNSLESVPSLSQLGYQNLTVLSLSHNRIFTLSLRDWSANLVGLYLNGNNLTQLGGKDIVLLASSVRLKDLTLHTNPWLCNCDTLDFLDFIKTNQSKFPELQRVACNSLDTPTFKLTRADVCPASVVPIIAGVLAFILLLIAGIFVVVYHRYQTEIKVWLFAHQLLPWLVNEADVDRDKVYDAFISYSHQDEDFVANTLVPKLETGPREFKLCLHYRDWPVGEFIGDQIERSVAESRRTVVVLSRNFLESEWGRMEFRTAHYNALQEGRVRVIAIIYGDIGPIEELEPELASYMRTNTYIQWGDRWFWEKLRYALPHPADCGNKNNEIVNE